MHKKYTDLLLDYCTNVQPGENVTINVESPAAAMARALFRGVLARDANPILRLTYPEMEQDLYELGTDRYFEREPSYELSEIKQVDAWIRIRAPRNQRSLQNADKTKISRFQKQMREFSNIRLKTKWVGTLFPTDAGAQDAGMSLDDYEQFVYAAMYLFEDDPVSKWQELQDFQSRLIERLSLADEVHIVAEGTDLRLRTKDRTWVNSAGHHNMPSGEVFTGPLEDSANGVIRYQIPASVNGIEVEDIELQFQDGKVVKAHAQKGNDLLQAQIDTDEGARFLGELGIGTNYQIQRATKSILYDEKIGGTVHLALGQAYPETGGLNTSAIHWDMVCDLRRGGAIYLDGELFQEDGRFKI